MSMEAISWALDEQGAAKTPLQRLILVYMADTVRPFSDGEVGGSLDFITDKVGAVANRDEVTEAIAELTGRGVLEWLIEEGRFRMSAFIDWEIAEEDRRAAIRRELEGAA